MATKIKPKTYIVVNGERRDVADVAVPASREFRGAWQFNGAAVEIDMAKAKEIRLSQLVTEAAEAKAIAEREELMASMGGDVTKKAAAAAKRGRFNADPKPAGVAALANAKTPAALAALKINDLF